jgi:hypothetical protein
MPRTRERSPYQRFLSHRIIYSVREHTAILLSTLDRIELCRHGGEVVPQLSETGSEDAEWAGHIDSSIPSGQHLFPLKKVRNSLI